MLTAATITQWTANLCFFAASAGCLYLILATILVHRFSTKKDRHENVTTPVTVLVPLCGYEPGLYRRLSLLCQQDYAGPVQIVCGTLNPADPAVRVVNQLRTLSPSRSIECHVNPRVHGHNLKISNLANMIVHARYDTLIMIDSDIEVNHDHLKKMVAELRKPGTGAITCLYRGVAVSSIWARFSAMRINSDFLPNVVVALAARCAHPCFGASIAISRETLRRIGGIAAFADQLWDDYAIGEAVREQGYDVVVAPFTVGHIYKASTAQAWLSDEFRAACTIRSINPVGHIGSVITYPTPLALIAVLLGGDQRALTLAFIAIACRMAANHATHYRFKADSGIVLLLPMHELLSFLIYVASFFISTVTWRGQRYQIPERTFIPDPR